MKRPEAQLIYEMLRTSLDDARFNIVTAERNVKTNRYKTAAKHCSISARLLRDLRLDVECDDVLPTRQRNFLSRGIEELYKELWNLANRLRRRMGRSAALSELGEALVVPKGLSRTAQAAEA